MFARFGVKWEVPIDFQHSIYLAKKFSLAFLEILINTSKLNRAQIAPSTAAVQCGKSFKNFIIETHFLPCSKKGALENFRTGPMEFSEE